MCHHRLLWMQVRAEYSYAVAAGAGVSDGLNSPFMVLANYIFGKNQHAGPRQSEEAGAATPASMDSGEPEKIAMTAPVVMQQAIGGLPAGGNGTNTGASVARSMAFIMPSKYQSVSSLPIPNDRERVKLVQVPEATYAAVRFKGLMSGKTALEREQQLRAACTQDSLQLNTDPFKVQFCSYNPPWTLPWLRTNDILIPLAEGQ